MGVEPVYPVCVSYQYENVLVGGFGDWTWSPAARASGSDRFNKNCAAAPPHDRKLKERFCPYVN
eukprot:654614-Pyramimonas_sp.AAC.1